MTDIMQKVADIAPKHYAFLVKTAGEIKASPFKDEILGELDGLVKKAFQMPGWASSAGKSFGGGAATVGGAVAAGIAYALAGDMYDAAKRGITKTRNYQNMLAANPELKQMPAKQVQQAFSVLHHFNPEFASDPTVSGAWVKRQATFGEDAFGNSQELGQLITSRKNLGDAKRLPAVPQFGGKGPKGLSKKDLEEQVGVLQDDLGAHAKGIHGRFNQWDAAVKQR